MPELRIDPLTGHRTLVAGERSLRPGGRPGCTPAEPIDAANDPFAEGHEDRTPPELYALREAGNAVDGPGWRVRVVPNLYPALGPGETREPAGEGGRGMPELLVSLPATGAHEVIVNSPRPVVSLAELDVEQVIEAVDVWRERMLVHANRRCVQLIVNERREAGASLPHTHAQLYALDFVPAALARERERASAYWTRTMGRGLAADMVAEEVRRDERVIAVDDEAVLIAPWASQLPYEMALFPREPRADFHAPGATGARLLHEAMRRLGRVIGTPPPLNMFVRTAPAGAEHFCWRIEILPRLTHIAGLELSAGVNVNIVTPEVAARELREA